MTTPLDDLVAHETGADCICGPLPVPVVTGEGDRFDIVIHRRLDGWTDQSDHGDHGLGGGTLPHMTTPPPQYPPPPQFPPEPPAPVPATDAKGRPGAWFWTPSGWRWRPNDPGFWNTTSGVLTALSIGFGALLLLGALYRAL